MLWGSYSLKEIRKEEGTKDLQKSKKTDKTDFKLKMIDDKEGNYIIIKGSIHQEDEILVSIYESNIRTYYFKYTKKILRNINKLY